MQCRSVPGTQSVPPPLPRVCRLTSVFAVSPVGRDDHLSALAHTHPAQARLQARDHLVGPQSGQGGGVKLLSGKRRRRIKQLRACSLKPAETCSRANSRGRSRGVEEGSVHQGAVVAVLEEVVGLAGQAAVRGLVDHPDLHRVFGVVEVHHVDVEDQNGRAGDDPSWGGRTERRWDGARRRARTQARGSPTPVSP